MGSVTAAISDAAMQMATAEAVLSPDPFTIAFQPAWKAAVEMTMKKTVALMRGTLLPAPAAGKGGW